MQPGGDEPIARWREAGEWWDLAPQREVTHRLDARGRFQEVIREGPPLALGETSQKDFKEDHTEDWVLRERKIRDEKAAAECGSLPVSYYERAALERHKLSGRVRSMGSRPDLRPLPTVVNVDQPVIHIPTAALPYAPLRCISGYCFGQSIMLAEEIPHLAAQAGLPAVGISDAHSLMGALEFCKAAERNGVKPLVGASIELPEGGRLGLIATSKRGYRNLSRIITDCHLSQPRQHPLGNWDTLAQYAGDLLCLTGGTFGPLDRYLIADQRAEAADLVERLVAIFGPGQVFLEVERSYLPWSGRIESRIRELAALYRLTMVAGGEVTHPRREQFPAQDILVCAHTLCTVDEILGRKPARDPHQPAVRRYPERALNAERFFRTAAEMHRLYADAPDLLANTLALADRVEGNVMPARTRLPNLYEDDNAALRQIIDARTPVYYPCLKPAQRQRLQMETDRICRLGFASHFLVAADFCEWAAERGIQFSGRGSVVDSAVSYVLGFSRIDAIAHGLHFDRFLPGDGSKRPDIDIDFEARRRDDIRNYMIRKYGVEHVAQVCAIGAYCVRGIVREIGKAMGLPNETIGFLAKRIHGSVPPDQILAALDKKPELRAANIPRERFRWVFRLAQRLMDVPRDVRCHSSGVVISREPIADTIPVMWSASPTDLNENLRLIQWDKRSAKSCFDKFDILCLRGQDVLGGCARRITQDDPTFRVTNVPLDDPETFRAFRSGELIGIPQSASPAMRQAHIRLRTVDLNDASLVQAGIRPGVGGAVKINELIARRRGKPYTFLHPALEEILGHTYGIIVFQEQVDQLLQTFGGYTGGQAEDIRDAIHKRRREDFGQQIRAQLLQRILDQGFGHAVAEHVFELVAGFKGYGFAQGHALAFAEISIRSVYCQQNFPAAYFASLLSAQPAGYYGPCTLVNEARSRGVAILGPDVNASRIEFSVEDVRSAMDPQIVLPSAGIRVGLMSVHGLSESFLARVTQDEPQHRLFTNIYDFCRRTLPDQPELEALILAGAFDSLHPNRRALLWQVPRILRHTRPNSTGTPSLPFTESDPPIPDDIEDFSEPERAVFHRRILGLDLQHHLMAYERERIAARGGITTADARQWQPGRRAIVVGNPIRLRFPPTASGKRVVFFDLEDETGLLNVTCFDETYQRDGHAIVCSPYVTIIGEAQDRDGHIAFLAERVFPYRPVLLQERDVTLPVTVADFLVG